MDKVIKVSDLIRLLERMDGLSLTELEKILAEEYTRQSTDEIYETGGYDNEHDKE